MEDWEKRLRRYAEFSDRYGNRVTVPISDLRAAVEELDRLKEFDPCVLCEQEVIDGVPHGCPDLDCASDGDEP